MIALETRGKIRKIREEEGRFLVSFPGHDGYFKVPATPEGATLREQLRAAQERGREISVTFDRQLTILAVR